MPDACGFDYQLDNSYFRTPSEAVITKAIASEMPDGKLWLAKNIFNTVVYGLMFAAAGVIRWIVQSVEKLSIDFNLYTASDDALTVWENSVGLPDTRVLDYPTDVCTRRQYVERRLRKENIVTIQEMQDFIDLIFPDYGIWLVNFKAEGGFRYDFRYDFQHGSDSRGRFTIDVYIPWLAIDPLDLENSPLSWDKLQDWLRDFVPAHVLLNPVYVPEASYAVITNPLDSQPIYAFSDGVGGWEDRDIYWKEIDVDGTVVNNKDTETILPSTTEITRSFTDSGTNLITDTNSVTVTALLQE